MLESCAGSDERDAREINQAIKKASYDLRYVHLSAYQEPCLWIADALVWAYGAGGDWRRRIEPLVLLAREAG